ncbi:anti-repressor SinI family protein [Lentibacillus sp. JNUCC-1]|nr:anti-repressor SinI family protein [Lentibacillus sp. JNUCC-1]
MSDQILDEEWLELIKTAKLLGLTAEEVRTFLLKNTKKANA